MYAEVEKGDTSSSYLLAPSSQLPIKCIGLSLECSDYTRVGSYM